MLGKTHALGGLVGWQLAVDLAAFGVHEQPAPVLALGYGFAVWGAYGPDMDHASATWARSFTGGPAVSRVIARAVGGHRMGTHSALSTVVAGGVLFGLLALAAVAGELPLAWRLTWTVAFMVGWASHLLLDGLTVKGIGLFHPLSRRRVRWGAMKTSKNARRLNAGERWTTRLLFAAGATSVLHMILGAFIVQT